MIQAIQAFVDGTEPDEVADTCDKTSERDPKEEEIPVRFACMYPLPPLPILPGHDLTTTRNDPLHSNTWSPFDWLL